MSELDQYDYDLPKHLIAQSPAVCRTDARLLVVNREQKSLEHKHIRDLPEILRKNDCLVINDTRVVPARLVGRRHTTGGHWEGLFLEVSPDGLWRVMCKTRGKLKSDTMKEPGSPRKVRLGAFTNPKFTLSRRPQYVIPRYRPTQATIDGEFA